MHFVYHPHHEAIIVSPEEYQKYLDNGWYDTPTKFPATNLANEVKSPEVALTKKKGRPPRVKPEEVQASPAI